MPRMTITEAARAAAVTPKMARHYESLGLVRPPFRSDAGYRLYGDDEVRTLRLIGRARSLGFGLPRIARILESAACGDADRLCEEIDAQIDETDRRLSELAGLLHALRSLRMAGAAALETLERSEAPASIGGSGNQRLERSAQDPKTLGRRAAPRRDEDGPSLWTLWGGRTAEPSRPHISRPASHPSWRG